MLFVSFIAVCLLNGPSLVRTDVELEECEGFLEEAKQAWTDHPTQAKCTEDDPLIERITDIFDSASFCPEQFAGEIRTLKEVYQELHNAVCDDEELHREFAAKAPCWYVARNCVLKAAKTIYSGDDILPETCREIDEEFDKCRDDWCDNLQVALLDYFKVKSVCATMDYSSSVKKESDFITFSIGIIWSLFLIFM